MTQRHRDFTRRRRSVLDRDQHGMDMDPDIDTDDERIDMSVIDRSGNRRRGNTFRKLIPLLFFAGIAFMIAKEEVPAVSNWWQRMVSPDAWLAKQTCQKAAIDQTENKAYVRLLRGGNVNKTRDGLYIDRLILGEMGSEGGEQEVEYSCYIDTDGKLVKLNRLKADGYAVPVQPTTENFTGKQDNQEAGQ